MADAVHADPGSLGIPFTRFERVVRVPGPAPVRTFVGLITTLAGSGCAKEFDDAGLIFRDRHVLT